MATAIDIDDDHNPDVDRTGKCPLFGDLDIERVGFIKLWRVVVDERTGEPIEGGTTLIGKEMPAHITDFAICKKYGAGIYRAQAFGKTGKILGKPRTLPLEDPDPQEEDDDGYERAEVDPNAGLPVVPIASQNGAPAARGIGPGGEGRVSNVSRAAPASMGPVAIRGLTPELQMAWVEKQQAEEKFERDRQREADRNAETMKFMMSLMAPRQDNGSNSQEAMMLRQEVSRLSNELSARSSDHYAAISQARSSHMREVDRLEKQLSDEREQHTKKMRELNDEITELEGAVAKLEAKALSDADPSDSSPGGIVKALVEKHGDKVLDMLMKFEEKAGLLSG